jgi:signal transduction histidine kinase
MENLINTWQDKINQSFLNLQKTTFQSIQFQDLEQLLESIIFHDDVEVNLFVKHFKIFQKLNLTELSELFDLLQEIIYSQPELSHYLPRVKTARNNITEQLILNKKIIEDNDLVWSEFTYYTPSAPDIQKILSEILWLLMTITSVNQTYLYLANLPYQVFKPFLALGNLTQEQKQTFYTNNLRADTDILLSQLIKTKHTIEIFPSDVYIKFPSIVYQNLDIQHGLAIPLFIENRILGFIILVGPPPPPQLENTSGFADDIIRSATSISGAMAIALDNTRLYEITNQRLAETQSINQITLAMLRSFHLEDILKIICENAIDLTRAAGSSVHLFNCNDHSFKLVYQSGFSVHKDITRPFSTTFLRKVVDRNDMVLINRSSIEPKDSTEDEKFSILAIPLKIHENIVGILDIIKKREKFTPEDIRIIQIFADQASIAIDHTNLYEQVGQTAKLEERQKMARNLHDSVNQNLYAILLYTRTIRKLINTNNNSKAIDILNTLSTTTKEALNELRIFIHELRPSILENEGLISAIHTRLENVEKKLGFNVSYSINPSELSFGDIRLDIQEAIYRITQEALNNIVKHAKAENIHVSLSISEIGINLAVSDDGIGFNPEVSQGYGLKSMRERAELLSAKLSIQSSPGQGSTIQVEVQL